LRARSILTRSAKRGDQRIHSRRPAVGRGPAALLDTAQPDLELAGLAAAELLGCEPSRERCHLVEAGDLPDARRVAGRICADVAHVADVERSREHLEERAIVAKKMDREGAACAAERERALRTEEAVEVGAQGLVAVRHRDRVGWARQAESPHSVQLAAQPTRQHGSLGMPGVPDLDRLAPNLEVTALPTPQLVSRQQLHERAAAGLGVDAPFDLRLRVRLRGNRAERTGAGAVTKPRDELRVVVAQPQHHQAAERLTAVGLRNAEMSLAFDEPGDEMAFTGGQTTIHLQIVAFRAAETSSRRDIIVLIERARSH
jgi:hypothetical protein